MYGNLHWLTIGNGLAADIAPAPPYRRLDVHLICNMPCPISASSRATAATTPAGGEMARL